MKKRILLVVLFIVILLQACVPTDPKDFLPYCKAQYEAQLLVDPHFPRSYIGVCVSALASDHKAGSYAAICGYEPVWEEIMEVYPQAEIHSRQECIEVMKAINE